MTNVFDIANVFGLIAIDFNSAPKSLKSLSPDSHEAGDWVIVCRSDFEEEAEALAFKIQDYDYVRIPLGEHTIYITHCC